MDSRKEWLKESQKRLVDLAEESVMVAISPLLPQQLKESTVSRILEEVNYIERTIDVVLGIDKYPIKLDPNMAANYHLN